MPLRTNSLSHWLLWCVEGSWASVFVQYIRSPGYFVVHFEEDIPKIEQLNTEINIDCSRRPSVQSDYNTQFKHGQ